MLVFSRNISCKISTDENFFEKNLGWQVVLEDFPKECEIMFSKMKDKKEVYPVDDNFIVHLKQVIQNGDLLIGLGAGDISKLMHKTEELLKTQEDVKCGNF